jgi:NAD(P)-dependent dehydrogenase (short-subunit alcohol dehydrogenase family)
MALPPNERWMQALLVEVALFGIKTTNVNPGFFRTELLTMQSTTYADKTV